MKTINKNIQLTIARYFYNRDNHRQSFCKECHQRLPNKPWTTWNKEADLDAISKEAAKAGWGLEACSGTFWFIRKLKSGNTLTIKADESNYLDGGERSIRKKAA